MGDGKRHTFALGVFEIFNERKKELKELKRRKKELKDLIKEVESDIRRKQRDINASRDLIKNIGKKRRK